MKVISLVTVAIFCAVAATTLWNVLPPRRLEEPSIDSRIAAVGVRQPPSLGDELALLRPRLEQLELPVKRRTRGLLPAKIHMPSIVIGGLRASVTHRWGSNTQRPSIFVGINCAADCAEQVQLLFVHATFPSSLTFGVVGHVGEARSKLAEWCPAATATVCASDQSRMRASQQPEMWDSMMLRQQEEIVVLLNRQVFSIMVGWDEVVRQRVKSIRRKTVFTIELDRNWTSTLCRLSPTDDPKRHGFPRVEPDQSSADLRTPFMSPDVVIGSFEPVRDVVNRYRAIASPKNASKDAKIWSLSAAAFLTGVSHISPSSKLFNATVDPQLAGSSDPTTFQNLRSQLEALSPLLRSVGVNERFELSSKSVCSKVNP